MFLFLYFTVRVSLSKRFPRHTSHLTYTVGKKCISTAISPFPSQASQRPPFTLNEKRFAFHPRARASGVAAKRSRMYGNAPGYLAGFERDVRPIGDWSIKMARDKYSSPVIDAQL